MNTPSTTTGSGQVIATQGIAPHPGFTQKLQGSAVDMGVAKTGAALATQVKAHNALGAGMKGGRRKRRQTKKTKKAKKHLRRKRRTMRGGVNAHILDIPEGGTVPGVSHTKNHLDGVNNLTALKNGKIYDNLQGAAPRTV